MRVEVDIADVDVGRAIVQMLLSQIKNLNDTLTWVFHEEDKVEIEDTKSAMKEVIRYNLTEVEYEKMGIADL